MHIDAKSFFLKISLRFSSVVRAYLGFCKGRRRCFGEFFGGAPPKVPCFLGFSREG